jgi:cytidylate kinase
MTVIAIDGSAASGKGTLSRRLAEHFRYAYLDTGLLYRAMAYLTLSLWTEQNDISEEMTFYKTQRYAMKGSQNVLAF